MDFSRHSAARRLVLVLLSSAPAALAGGSIGSAVSCADQYGVIGPCGTTIGKQLRTWSGWVPRGAPLESDEARSAGGLPFRGVALSADGTVIAAGSDGPRATAGHCGGRASGSSEHAPASLESKAQRSRGSG